MKTISYESPCGTLILGEHDGKICLCDWRYNKQRNTIDKRLRSKFTSTDKSSEIEERPEILDRAIAQLDEYFCGKRKEFNLPLELAGTDFQMRVWTELTKIPYGSAITYAELARRVGMPKAFRAVARANGRNALSILVPCHRVIGSNGRLTGYGGGLDAKRYLLELEAKTSP